jgi:choline dehydrogenase-like flavoprotein
MRTSLIIGSGPAAAGVALALVRDPNQNIIILDVGGELDEGRKSLLDSISSLREENWPEDALASISRQPVRVLNSALPEKRSYGSDFPFRDFGQLTGVHALGQTNRSVISGAYGGFSNVWGAQIMPFSAATFDTWPISSKEMEAHYRVALNEMSLTGNEDDLSVLFPLISSARPLPKLAERTQKVLDRYEQRRGQLQSLGITVGRARLAMCSDSCINCGLCMTGCPYGLIYSASHTFDRLRSAGRITYRRNVLATHLSENGGVPRVQVRDLSTGREESLSADRIYVACGGIGTTRLVLGSLGIFGEAVELSESVQFVMPVVSKDATVDPRCERDFTLNQFNVVYDASGHGFDLCQIHFYPYNPAFESSLPSTLQHRFAKPLTTALLRRLTVGLGYIPSWASPKVKVTAHEGVNGNLPDLIIDRAQTTARWPNMLKELCKVFLHAAPSLDLWPILPMVSVSPAAKSYHFGGSFPHSDVRAGFGTDRQGRLDRWENIHLVDASVFPNVPATTFTLTIMANAHRIASESLESAQ